MVPLSLVSPHDHIQKVRNFSADHAPGNSQKRAEMPV
jgi:hypothetical protein